MTLTELKDGGKPALARALARIERSPRDPAMLAMLDEAFVTGNGTTIGVTGPPGVGKSSLIDALVREFRAREIRIGVIAVDPSSARSGGALLGDRARFSSLDPSDDGVFTRSMASRGRLGGLADLVYPAATLMRAVFDIVIVETVGVGQSEIDIARMADSTMLCIQPASGDSLQFIKAGIMEIPDVIVITKSDIGAAARRAASDLRSALSVTLPGMDDQAASGPEVHTVSSRDGSGIEGLVNGLLARRNILLGNPGLAGSRMDQAREWCRDSIRVQFGRVGLQRAEEALAKALSMGPEPFKALSTISSRFETDFAKLDFR